MRSVYFVARMSPEKGLVQCKAYKQADSAKRAYKQASPDGLTQTVLLTVSRYAGAWWPRSSKVLLKKVFAVQ